MTDIAIPPSRRPKRVTAIPESGVPLEAVKPYLRKPKYPLLTMKIGESFFLSRVPDDITRTQDSVQKSAYSLRRRGRHIRIATRRTTDGKTGLRVWRTE